MRQPEGIEEGQLHKAISHTMLFFGFGLHQFSSYSSQHLSISVII